MEEEINNRFIFNKIFTGSYLIYNLGNELINFIKTDDNGSCYGNKRLIYINPYGNRSFDFKDNTEYVFHIMGVKYEGKSYYELVAVSSVDNSTKTLYNKNTGDERSGYDKCDLRFNGYLLSEVFSDSKSHLCSFVAKKFYRVKKGIRIFFKVNSDVDEVSKNIELFEENDTSKIYVINVLCNPQHSMCYSRNIDVSVLNKIISSLYLEENDDNIVLDMDEQCFAVISDRTNLEDSVSNQIAYFLGRDRVLMSHFIDLLSKKVSSKIPFDKDTKYEILREKNKIDLFIKIINGDDVSIIVIENKIDSYINGIILNGEEKVESQLSKYYQYITTNDDFKDVNNKYFFILEPRYSSITRKKLDDNFLDGDKYNIVYYDELFNILENNEFNPYSKNIKEDKNDRLNRLFLYNQFKSGIEYVMFSKAEQMQRTAYIRLKQKLNELKSKEL